MLSQGYKPVPSHAPRPQPLTKTSLSVSIRLDGLGEGGTALEASCGTAAAPRSVKTGLPLARWAGALLASAMTVTLFTAPTAASAPGFSVTGSMKGKLDDVVCKSLESSIHYTMAIATWWMHKPNEPGVYQNYTLNVYLPPKFGTFTLTSNGKTPPYVLLLTTPGERWLSTSGSVTFKSSDQGSLKAVLTRYKPSSPRNVVTVTGSFACSPE